MLKTENTMNCEFREENTISAADYLTTYHPSTTEPSSSIRHGYTRSIISSPFQHQETDMHLGPYFHHHRMEYGLPPAHLLNCSASQEEYKPVNSNRFHPYIANVNSVHLSLHDSSAIPRNVNLPNSSVMQLTTSPMIPASLPTSSASLNLCNNYDQICRTATHRSEHHTKAHDRSHEKKEAFSSDYVIDDILNLDDLDSQKIVYLPSVDSQVCNHHNTLIPPRQQEIKHLLPLTKQPNNQDFSTSVIEPEYFLYQPQINHQQQQDSNSFNDAASLVTPGPSKFPQVYGEQLPFEAATSMVPKSARKRKRTSQISKSDALALICKCTICDRWFPTPTHLKKHYNTKLHKNEVKAAAQPDQHYGTAPAVDSTIGSSENGQASHSILASQSEAIQNSFNYMETFQVIPQQEENFIQSTTESHVINSQDQYNTANLKAVNTNTASYPTNIELELLHPDFVTIDHTNEMSQMLSVNDCSSKLSSYNASVLYAMPNRLLMGGAKACQEDAISYYLQDIPKTLFDHNHMTQPSAATIQPSPVSSSISSTETGTKTLKMDTTCACTICDKVFSKSCYLKQHNKTYHSGAEFKCTRCGKRFSSKIRRDQHLEKHDGKKPFSCEYDDCEKSFNHKPDLQRHKAVHTGQLQHVCGKCSKAFVRQDHMLKHMTTRGCKPM